MSSQQRKILPYTRHSKSFNRYLYKITLLGTLFIFIKIIGRKKRVFSTSNNIFFQFYGWLLVGENGPCTGRGHLFNKVNHFLSWYLFFAKPICCSGWNSDGRIINSESNQLVPVPFSIFSPSTRSSVYSMLQTYRWVSWRMWPTESAYPLWIATELKTNDCFVTYFFPVPFRWGHKRRIHNNRLNMFFAGMVYYFHISIWWWVQQDYAKYSKIL